MQPPEISSKLLHENADVLGERQDDLPCWQCGEYGDTLIVKAAYSTCDVCQSCAKKLGIEWQKEAREERVILQFLSG